MGKLIFELNEFNEGLLQTSAATCENISKFISRGRVSFGIDEDYDSEFLEPWSQWVTAHTGVSCSEHQIKHLGDIYDKQIEHVWDTHPDKFGIVWGCLNSRNPRSADIGYFPDPWTLKSCTTINHRKSILNFLQFAVSTRSFDSFSDKFKAYFSIAPHLVISSLQLARGIDLDLLKITRKFSGKVTINSSYVYAIIEYLNFNAFLRDQKFNFEKTDVFFVNMLAHAQHYYWNTDNHALIDFCLELVNVMLGKANNNYENIILFNGLSQEFSGNLEEWHSWVPKGGWQSFVNDKLGIECKVQPCMSYDCNLFFENQQKITNASERLSRIQTPDGQQLFLCENNAQDNNKLFVRLQYYGPGDQSFIDGNSSFLIMNNFDLAAIRSGRHCQESVAFGIIPEHLYLNSNLRNTDSIGLYL